MIVEIVKIDKEYLDVTENKTTGLDLFFMNQQLKSLNKHLGNDDVDYTNINKNPTFVITPFESEESEEVKKKLKRKSVDGSDSKSNDDIDNCNKFSCLVKSNYFNYNLELEGYRIKMTKDSLKNKKGKVCLFIFSLKDLILRHNDVSIAEDIIQIFDPKKLFEILRQKEVNVKLLKNDQMKSIKVRNIKFEEDQISETVNNYRNSTAVRLFENQQPNFQNNIILFLVLGFLCICYILVIIYG